MWSHLLAQVPALGYPCALLRISIHVHDRTPIGVLYKQMCGCTKFHHYTRHAKFLSQENNNSDNNQVSLRIEVIAITRLVSTHRHRHTHKSFAYCASTVIPIQLSSTGTLVHYSGTMSQCRQILLGQDK